VLAAVDVLMSKVRRLRKNNPPLSGCVDESLHALALLPALLEPLALKLAKQAAIAPSRAEVFALKALLRVTKLHLEWMARKGSHSEQSRLQSELGVQQEEAMRGRLLAVLQALARLDPSPPPPHTPPSSPPPQRDDNRAARSSARCGSWGPQAASWAEVGGVRVLGVGALIVGVEYFFPTLQARMLQASQLLPGLHRVGPSSRRSLSSHLSSHSSSHLSSHVSGHPHLAAHLLKRISTSPDLLHPLLSPPPR
jgi:hypothetical protein